LDKFEKRLAQWKSNFIHLGEIQVANFCLLYTSHLLDVLLWISKVGNQENRQYKDKLPLGRMSREKQGNTSSKMEQSACEKRKVR